MKKNSMSYDTAHPRGNNYVRNRVAFSMIKSHWFKFSFNSPLERHYVIARAYCAVRVGYAHRTGKSTANMLQASREEFLVLGHRLGRERYTELNLQRTFGRKSMCLVTF